MFVPLTTVLAEMTLSEKLLDAATLTIVGMGTVFLCLWLMGEIFDVLRKMFNPTPVSAQPKVSAPAKIAAPKPEAHLIPLITAAAMAVVGKPVVVRRITFINSNTVSGWSEAGRTSIHQSHNLHRN
jgi:Na+-transporting methylmalonyl-CoA/oxaloacetate decarboxylase gamma subunit